MSFSDLIIKQLEFAGFGDDSKKLFEENVNMFTRAFIHKSFQKENNGSLFKIVGSSEISTSCFHIILKKFPELDQQKMTNAIANIGPILHKIGEESGFENHIQHIDEFDHNHTYIVDTVKSFCGALSIICRNNYSYDVTRHIVRFLSGAVESWLLKNGQLEVNTLNSPGMELKEYWEKKYSEKMTMRRMFVFIEHGKLDIEACAIDPHKRKVIARARGRTQKLAKRLASEKAMKILKDQDKCESEESSEFESANDE